MKDRSKIITALTTMPDEAFSWFVLAALPKAMTQGAISQIWPDGIGGFSQASQKSITALRQAADSYVKETP